MAEGRIKNITLFEKQYERVEESKLKGVNFSRFVREMIDSHLDDYIEKSNK